MTSCLSVDVKDSPVCSAVNDSCYRMTVAIGNAHIVEEYDVSEARIVASNTIGQPYCLLGAAKVETKVPHAIIDSFPNQIAIISRILADSGKYGDVGDRGRMVG